MLLLRDSTATCSSSCVLVERLCNKDLQPIHLRHPTCVPIGFPLRSQRTEGLGLPVAMQLQSSSELISTSESLITCSHCG